MARALAADPLVLLMDEPFSAVDPVVRGELHEFFLGLQRELSKTIIMITHDIDEAIKLGDQVAILRVGGKLAQVGTPQQLLDEPADAFVEGFVGKDRGYRSLSFQPASGLTLGDVQVVREAGFTGGDAPVLVVDGDARPIGWSDPARSGSVMALGATFDPETDSLRTALDAALTSPVGLAVAVDRRVPPVRRGGRRRHDPAPGHPDPGTDRRVDRGPDPRRAGRRRTSRRPPIRRTSRAPFDDPDATSVRGVPPVESVGTVEPSPRRVPPPAPGRPSEDPDATRVAGPLPEQDEDPDATRDRRPTARAGRDPDASRSPSRVRTGG